MLWHGSISPGENPRIFERRLWGFGLIVVFVVAVVESCCCLLALLLQDVLDSLHVEVSFAWFLYGVAGASGCCSCGNEKMHYKLLVFQR